MVLSTSRESMGAVVDLVCTELAVPVVIRGEHLVIPVEVKKSEKSWGEMEEVGVYNGFKS
jgi:hypothetical protein